MNDLNSSSMDNASLGAAIERIAILLELEGQSPVRVAAYRHAARTVREAPKPIVAAIAEEGVEGLHRLGLGYLIAGALVDWARTGRLPLLEQLELDEREHGPRDRLQQVPGVGPSLSESIHDLLGVSTLSELAVAATDGRLASVPGFGPRRIELVQRVLAACGVSAPGASESRQLALPLGAHSPRSPVWRGTRTRLYALAARAGRRPAHPTSRP